MEAKIDIPILFESSTIASAESNWNHLPNHAEQHCSEIVMSRYCE